MNPIADTGFIVATFIERDKWHHDCLELYRKATSVIVPQTVLAEVAYLLHRDGKPIVADGPAAYTSTLPLAALHKAIQTRRVPVKYSNHAGAYVCNHVFYVARYEVERLGLATRCGFIHVPMPNDALSLADMIDAIQVCIQQLMEGR